MLGFGFASYANEFVSYFRAFSSYPPLYIDAEELQFLEANNI